MLQCEGEFKGWLFIQRAGGWQPMRKATGEQVKAIYDAVCAEQDRRAAGGRAPGRKVKLIVGAERA